MSGPELKNLFKQPGSELPPDRTYLDGLFDRWRKAEDEREERLKHYLQWLAVRWAVIWFLIALGVWWLLSLLRG